MYKTSQHKGVSWHQHSRNWQSQLKVFGRVISLGFFNDEAEAAMVYENAVEKINAFIDTTFSKTRIEHDEIEPSLQKAHEGLDRQIQRETEATASKEERKLSQTLQLRDRLIKMIKCREEAGFTQEEIDLLQGQLKIINGCLGSAL